MEREEIALDTDGAQDHPEGIALVLEHGTLLDMELEVGQAAGALRRGLRCVVQADPHLLQGVHQRDALPVLQVAHVFDIEVSRERA